jgi:hypothetical protein
VKRPEIVASSVTLRCECGEEYEFDGIHDGWQHLMQCDDCGRIVSVQFDDPIVQYDRGNLTAVTR